MKRQSIAQTLCPREQEIVNLVMSCRCPDGSEDALRVHAADCVACAEILELARVLHADQKTLCDEAPVPSAGAVWWRATIRARAEAARTAGQPITLLQGIAAATAVGLAVGLTGGWWRSIVQSGAWIDRFGDMVSPALLILLVLAVCLIAAPVAVYLATADEP